MQLVMDDTNTDFIELVATALVKKMMPISSELARVAAEENAPGVGLTRGQLAKKLGMTQGTADFDRMADDVLPSYRNGTQRRWNSRAVDLKLQDYYE